ncbi:MAG: hypothetical protein IJO29_02670 [Oscillospiraceae bacterium]|nr:hypothetical protein [Oscillospiraceae bacterium]
MKNRILSLIISLSVCTAAAISLPSCGDRSADSSSSSDVSGSSSSDVLPESNSQNSTADSSSSNSSASEVLDSSGKVTVVWTSTADAPGDTDLFTAKFKVLGDASGLNEVTIGGDIVVSDASFQNINVEVVAGGVDIGGADAAAATPEGAAIVIDTKGANTGDEVSLTFKLANVDVCTSFDFIVLFDAEVLEFVDITPSTTMDTCGQLNYNVG